jgi:S1-C subfamily serine protease
MKSLKGLGVLGSSFLGYLTYKQVQYDEPFPSPAYCAAWKRQDVKLELYLVLGALLREDTKGLIVFDIVRGSAADKGGLQKGDIIVSIKDPEIGEHECVSISDYSTVMEENSNPDKVFKIKRGTEQMIFPIHLDQK